MSAFDPDAFLDGASDEPISDQYENCPEGTFRAQVDKKEMTSVTTGDGERHIFRITWDILDDQVREQLDRDKVLVRQDIWLDFDESGALATGKGKNVSLGKLYTALGINKPGVRPRDVDGMAMVHVAHRSRKNNPEIKDANVDRVAPIG